MPSYNINWNKSSCPPEVLKFQIWMIPRDICPPLKADIAQFQCHYLKTSSFCLDFGDTVENFWQLNMPDASSETY